jgi:hypothetical protein
MITETTLESEVPQSVRIRSGTSRAVGVAYFAPLCSEDYQYLGVPDGALRSNFAHCGEIVRLADRLGFQNILLPSGYEVGQDPANPLTKPRPPVSFFLIHIISTLIVGL